MSIEIIGILSSIILLASVSFRSTTPKKNMLMRTINIVGSIGFVIYGLLLPAYSTAGLNVAVIIINIIYTVLEWRNLKQNEDMSDTGTKN